MTVNQRTVNRGRLADLKDEQYKLRVEIDAAVKGIVVHFDPMDQDLLYTDKIDPHRLKIYFGAIERKKKQLDRVNAEIAKLEAELGEGE